MLTAVIGSRFVVQLHDATTLHFDLRLQIGDVLRSWAVPKGPSLDPKTRRLAVPVEDHDLEAGDFEGVHEGSRRGSGAVIIWDEGAAEIVTDEPPHLSFVLHGSKLAGGFALTKTGERRWILVKARDDAARAGSDIVAESPASVRSGLTWQDLASRLQRLSPPRRRSAVERGGQFRREVIPSLGEDPVQVRADRAMREVETLADLAVAHALGRQLDDLQFLGVS